MCIGKANNWHKYSAAGLAATAANVALPPPELRVVYGDTDSMFVHVLPTALHRSHQQQQLLHDAFDRMREFTRACNALLPNPMELELEKIFLPCILVTKKRYVGMAFESSKQAEGTFDAKGIESVRRDTCPLVQVSRAA
jgi:DNA polymerase zeta